MSKSKFIKIQIMVNPRQKCTINFVAKYPYPEYQ